MSKTCPTCGGEGVVKSEETIAIETARKLRELVERAGDGGPEAYLVRINPRVSAWFTADGARELHALEEQTGRWFHFEGSEGLPLDHFAVTMEGSRDEIAEQAVPFRAGEEVHVDLVEPHMYNPDDAVAKIDGYLISVTNGIAFVGEKKLVRIEEAGRTAATAALTGSDAEAAEAAATEREKDRRRAEDRARRSAAAKRGAAARKAREEAEKAEKAAPKAGSKRAAGDGAAKPDDEDGSKPRRGRRRRAGEDAAETGAAEPAAATPSDDGSKPRRGRRRKRADDDTAAAPAADPAPAADEDGAKPRRGRRRKRTDEESVEADAVQALTDEDAAEAGTGPGALDESGEDGDALSSRPRRRGRRGGRRRSRAKTTSE